MNTSNSGGSDNEKKLLHQEDHEIMDIDLSKSNEQIPNDNDNEAEFEYDKKS